MFERFRKKKDEFKHVSSKDADIDDLTVNNMQYEPQKIESTQGGGVMEEPSSRPSEQVKIPETIQQTSMSSSVDDIGIRALMDKRTKLEEAIDYVGIMIKNLKDKRTRLEKNIEDESVDIKNLKEKLIKVGQYIEEEKQGIKELQQKRSNVEREADDVATIINNLREKLVTIDHIVNEEGSKIEKFKDTSSKAD